MKRIRILPLLLVLVLLLCACTAQHDDPPEQGLKDAASDDTDPKDTVLEETGFIYHKEDPVSIDYWYDAEEFVYVPLTLEHLQAMFPENMPQWMELSGSAQFSADADLISITLETPTQNPEVTMTISIADKVMYTHKKYHYDSAPPTVRNGIQYFILDQSGSWGHWLCAMALIHDVPFFVESSGHGQRDTETTEAIKEDFQQVLDYFTHIEKGFVEKANIEFPEKAQYYQLNYSYEEACADETFGKYIPQLSADARKELWQREKYWYDGEFENRISAEWNHKEGFISWFLFAEDDFAANIPHEDEQAVFSIDTLTAEQIQDAVIYYSDDTIPCLEIVVEYEDMVLFFFSNGVSSEDVYELITSLPRA